MLAIIPARGGSKEVSRKNIRTLGGKPLIHWTIEAAINNGLIVLRFFFPPFLASSRASVLPFVLPFSVKNNVPLKDPFQGSFKRAYIYTYVYIHTHLYIYIY